MGTKKGGRRWTARRAYMPAKTKFKPSSFRKRRKRRERKRERFVIEFRGIWKNLFRMFD